MCIELARHAGGARAHIAHLLGGACESDIGRVAFDLTIPGRVETEGREEVDVAHALSKLCTARKLV